MKAYIVLAAMLLALAMLCACGQTVQENVTLPTEQAAEGTTQEYNIIPDDEYYPEGYMGYRYPVRPALASWLEVRSSPESIQIPDEVITGMTTEALAQSVVCYPWYGWHSEMMLSSQSSQPADFVRSWFDRRFREFPAMQALSQRTDAREALEKLDGMYQAFSGPYSSQGIDPQLMLQSAQFGGEGIPDNAHELNFRFISAQGNLRYYLDDEEITPSETFAASPTADGTLRMYFNVEELAAILESSHHNELAQKLRQVEDGTYIGEILYLSDDLFPISNLSVEIGWEVNSHTPVRFSIK